jgi:hypothetical protein
MLFFEDLVHVVISPITIWPSIDLSLPEIILVLYDTVSHFGHQLFIKDV